MTRGLDFKRMGVLVPVPGKPPKPLEQLTIGQGNRHGLQRMEIIRINVSGNSCSSRGYIFSN